MGIRKGRDCGVEEVFLWVVLFVFLRLGCVSWIVSGGWVGDGGNWVWDVGVEGGFFVGWEVVGLDKGCWVVVLGVVVVVLVFDGMNYYCLIVDGEDWVCWDVDLVFYCMDG